ncbi:phage tail protein [Nocardioides yefusunii]|uniref:Phage tail tape measure protein n=1 Tax=Nocardioides yefusunii TaxID=2500546 RepID=A0ABW1R0N1_9ACTN|nr:hypothetical protein [Nocardioides yefusunii]
MSAGRPVRVAVVGDSGDLRRALSQAEAALDDVGDTAVDNGRRVEAALGATAESADATASASSQLAGGLGDLAGGMAAAGFISEDTAAAFDTASQAIMGVTGAADLMNLATEKIPGIHKVATAATKGLAAAKRALGVAIRFAMGPVGLIMIAITALIAIVTVLWKNNEGFRKAVIKVWEAVKDGVGAAIDWVSDKISGLIDFFKKLPGRMTQAVSGLWNGIKDGFKGAINWVIDKWNNFSISLPGVKVPGLGQVGGFTLNTPDIPRLNMGGIVTRATTITAGEGRPEAILPLDRLGGLGGGDVNIYMHPTSDPVAVGRELQKVLDAFRLAGGRGLGAGVPG